MKHQYFGDKTDYIKHGTLRALSAAGIPLGIHWTLTPDDQSSDGSRTTYIHKPAEWRHFDPPLFDVIAESLKNNRRHLAILNEYSLLKNIGQCFDEWNSVHNLRHRNLISFTQKLTSNSLVFLDPDNGLEVDSIKKDSPASNKYVFFSEIKYLWQAGFSLLIYQHFPRVNRQEYITARFSQLKQHAPDAQMLALMTSHVAFLALIQPKQNKITKTLAKISTHWAPHITLFS